jgi:hypothetical protein
MSVHEEWTVSSVENGYVLITLHNCDVHENRSADDVGADARDAGKIRVRPEIRMMAKEMLSANNTTPSRVWTALKLKATDRDSHSANPTILLDQVPPIGWLQNLKKTTTKLNKCVGPCTDAKMRSATDQEAVDRMMKVSPFHPHPPFSI